MKHQQSLGSEPGAHGTRQRVSACRHRLRRARAEHRTANLSEDRVEEAANELGSILVVDATSLDSEMTAQTDNLRAS